jgi:hypothetical protein
VFDRVEVDVIKVCLEVVFVSDRVLPETWLPDAATPLSQLIGRNEGFSAADGQPSFREVAFDTTPST